MLRDPQYYAFFAPFKQKYTKNFQKRERRQMETSQGAVSEFVRPQLEQLVALFASRAARCGAATLVQIWMPQTDVSGWQFLATSNCPYALIGTGDSFSILRSVSAAQCLGIALPPSGASTIVKTFVHERAFYHEDITLVPSFARCPTTEEAVRFGARTALVLPIWRGIPGQYNDPAPIASKNRPILMSSFLNAIAVTCTH